MVHENVGQVFSGACVSPAGLDDREARNKTPGETLAPQKPILSFISLVAYKFA
jgi:hypothetical protein